MKRVPLLLCLIFLFNCKSSDEMNPDEVVLTKAEEILLDQYEHMVFKFDTEWPTSGLTEKWSGDVKLFLDGGTTDTYLENSQEVLTKMNSFFTDGTRFVLVDNEEDSDIHLFLGSREEMGELWPDMLEFIATDNSYTGYYLYQWDSSFQIFTGRIWVSNTSIPLLRHELGHILGLGHADATGCGSGDRSIMCRGLASDFSNADETIIRLLYHPDVAPGLSYNQLRTVIEELLLTNAVGF